MTENGQDKILLHATKPAVTSPWLLGDEKTVTAATVQQDAKGYLHVVDTVQFGLGE